MHCMIKEFKLWALLIMFLGVQFAKAQSITFTLPDTIVQRNEFIKVPILVEKFKNLTSIQFTLTWNSQVLEYVNATSDVLDNVAFGSSQTDNGFLFVSWFISTAEPLSFETSVAAFVVEFQAIGALGDSSEVFIGDTPLDFVVTQSNQSEDLFLSLDDGLGMVRIEENTILQVTNTIGNVDCFGASNGFIDLTIVPSDGVSVNWTGPSGFQSNEEDLSGLSPGSYIYRIENMDNEVLSQDTLLVKGPEEALVVENIFIENNDCDDSNHEVEIQVMGGSPPYIYTLGSNIQAKPSFSNLSSGSFELIITDSIGCQIESSLEISPVIPLEVSLGVDRTICIGDTLELEIGNFSSYNWSTGSNASSLKVFEGGSYAVTVTDEDGCSASDSVLVTATNDTRLEVDQSTFMACPEEEVTLAVKGSTEVVWIDTSNTLTINDPLSPIAKPIFPTNYLVVGEGKCNQDTVSVFIDVLEAMGTAGPDTCIGFGDEWELQAEGGISYEWQPTNFPVSNPSIANPIVQPDFTTIFAVQITDENNCTYIDSVKIVVATDPEEVRMVNLITPNGDGKNDFLVIPGIVKFGTNTLRVFNRWGNVVYQKVNYMHDEERFDGTFHSKPLPVGNYYYVLSFRTKQFKQTLTIIRE